MYRTITQVTFSSFKPPLSDTHPPPLDTKYPMIIIIIIRLKLNKTKINVRVKQTNIDHSLLSGTNQNAVFNKTQRNMK